MARLVGCRAPVYPPQDEVCAVGNDGVAQHPICEQDAYVPRWGGVGFPGDMKVNGGPMVGLVGGFRGAR